MVGCGEVKLGAECELGDFASFADEIAPKGEGVVFEAAGKILEIERGRVVLG